MSEGRVNPTLLPAAVLAALGLAQEDPGTLCDWPPEPRYEARTTICLSMVVIEQPPVPLEPTPFRRQDLPPLLPIPDDFNARMAEQVPTSFAATLDEDAPTWAPGPAPAAPDEALDPPLELPLDRARGLHLRQLRRAHKRAMEERQELRRLAVLRALEADERLPPDVLAALTEEG